MTQSVNSSLDLVSTTIPINVAELLPWIVSGAVLCMMLFSVYGAYIKSLTHSSFEKKAGEITYTYTLRRRLWKKSYIIIIQSNEMLPHVEYESNDLPEAISRMVVMKI